MPEYDDDLSQAQRERLLEEYPEELAEVLQEIKKRWGHRPFSWDCWDFAVGETLDLPISRTTHDPTCNLWLLGLDIGALQRTDDGLVRIPETIEPIGEVEWTPETVQAVASLEEAEAHA